MDLSAEHYFRAGEERMAQALQLYKSGRSYALTMYVSGLAVECILRAFRWRKEPQFSGRHDLTELFKASGLLEIEEDGMRRKDFSEEAIREQGLRLKVAMNSIVRLWVNNLRFASEARLRSHLVAMGAQQGKRGDLSKACALELLNAAKTIVDKGVALWISSRK
jgi:HEPN domain-containing protein